MSETPEHDAYCSTFPCRACLEEQLEAAEAERDAALAAIERVRELHAPTRGFGRDVYWCSASCEATSDGDPTDWPCPTIRALGGESDG